MKEGFIYKSDLDDALDKLRRQKRRIEQDKEDAKAHFIAKEEIARLRREITALGETPVA